MVLMPLNFVALEGKIEEILRGENCKKKYHLKLLCSQFYEKIYVVLTLRMQILYSERYFPGVVRNKQTRSNKKIATIFWIIFWVYKSLAILYSLIIRKYA